MSGEAVSSQVQPHGAAVRRGPAAWVVVLLTLVGVAVVLLAFGAGVGVGFWAAGTGGATTGAAAPDPADPPAGVPSPLDPCLVGTWRTTEHTESYETDDGPASLTDLDRTMTFTADGTQTITYDASRATVTTDQGALPAVFDGTVVYRTATAGTAMTFQVVRSEGTVQVLGTDGQVAQEDAIEPGTGDVSYTCDDATFVQEAEGYRSAYERVG